MKIRFGITIGIMVGLCGLAVMLKGGEDSHGHRHLFKEKQFHYQAFRTLGHSAYDGALPGEIMSVISRISDDESWKDEWSAMAGRCERMAERAVDPISKSNALLRAANYYRAAEFFMHPSEADSEAKKVFYHKSRKAFQAALRYRMIPHHIYGVPWENGIMSVYCFQGNRNAPVVLVNGGYDSTNEESYFFGGAALIKRGYTVVMFEGPGQSGMIRDHNARFTPRWHEPVGKVLDFLITREPDFADRKKILVGISMGGILAGRAAAFEKRLDGIVLFGSPYGMQDAALFQMPGIGQWLYMGGYRKTLDAFVGVKQKWDRGVRWGVRNGLWTMGGNGPYDLVTRMSAYTLKDIQDKISCHVLCMYGAKDIYVSDDKQMNLFRSSFKGAASYAMKVFSEEDGSAEHCQIGSVEQAVQEIVSWMKTCGLDR